MAGLLDKIAPDIAKLADEKGLRIVNEQHDPSSFGNASIEWASTDFGLSVVRDRGQVAVEISPPDQADWHDLENILAFIGRKPRSQSFAALAVALSENYQKVAALMTSDLAEVGFLTFEKQQSAAFLQKLFPTSIHFLLS
jgi:hypothetical protein